MANLIVRWHPDRKRRLLLCTHYDTRPYPDRDPKNPRGKFVGANDGGSGVALMMELGNEMRELKPQFGVDFVFFDGEEFVFSASDRYFVGSEYFAATTPNTTMVIATAGVCSWIWSATRISTSTRSRTAFFGRTPVRWWARYGRLPRGSGSASSSAKKKYEVQDDHLPLHNLGGIPTCDIIDFDYPAWHTQNDTPEHCSALSLAKVGWVMREWLATAKPEGE